MFITKKQSPSCGIRCGAAFVPHLAAPEAVAKRVKSEFRRRLRKKGYTKVSTGGPNKVTKEVAQMTSPQKKLLGGDRSATAVGGQKTVPKREKDASFVLKNLSHIFAVMTCCLH